MMQDRVPVCHRPSSFLHFDGVHGPLRVGKMTAQNPPWSGQAGQEGSGSSLIGRGPYRDTTLQPPP